MNSNLGHSHSHSSSELELDEEREGEEDEPQFHLDDIQDIELNPNPDETVLLRRMYGCHSDGCEILRQGDHVEGLSGEGEGGTTIPLKAPRFSHSRRGSENSILTVRRERWESVEVEELKEGVAQRIGREEVREEEKAEEADDERPSTVEGIEIPRSM